jgi:hypothetical protein
LAKPHPGFGGLNIKESAVPLHVLAPIGLALVLTILGKRW